MCLQREWSRTCLESNRRRGDKGQFVDTKPNIKSEFDYIISWKEI